MPHADLVIEASGGSKVYVNLASAANCTSMSFAYVSAIDPGTIVEIYGDGPISTCETAPDCKFSASGGAELKVSSTYSDSDANVTRLEATSGGKLSFEATSQVAKAYCTSSASLYSQVNATALVCKSPAGAPLDISSTGLSLSSTASGTLCCREFDCDPYPPSPPPSPPSPPPPSPSPPVGYGGDSAPCFSRDTTACRVVDSEARPLAALAECWGSATPAKVAAERVVLPMLSAGDLVVSTHANGRLEFSRIVVNQHRQAFSAPSAPLITLLHAEGSLTLTPDHFLLVDDRYARAADAKVRMCTAGQLHLGLVVPALAAHLALAGG